MFKNIIQHTLLCTFILWVISLLFPIALALKVWVGIALLTTYLVLSFGVKSALGWFLLIAATLFCMASIWLESVPLGFNIWLGAFLSAIYFSLATGGKYNTKYDFGEEHVFSGSSGTDWLGDYYGHGMTRIHSDDFNL